MLTITILTEVKMDENIKIRNVKIEDAKSILEIYSPYIKNTAITFEWQVPSLEDFENRIKTISQKFPYIVAEENSEIKGYAYANTFRGRKAYSWTAESSIYIRQDCRGQGIGKILLQELENRLAQQGILNLYAVIASTDKEDEYLTNDSVRFHEKMGYVEPGIFSKCGFKFNRWYDTTTMVKFLGEHTDCPKNVLFVENKVPDLETVQKKYRKLTKFLVEKNISITTMESCTSGFIASLITDTEGSSAIFKGGFVTYSNEAKITNGVDAAIINQYGVYSKETAVAMAKSSAKKMSTRIGIGVTGTFGNVDLANNDSVPGKFFAAVEIDGKSVVNEFSLPENISRFESKLCVAEKVYEMLAAELVLDK